MSYHLEKECACGYNTFKRSNWSTHQKRCKLIESADKELISTLKEQLETNKQQLASKDEQMKAKDRQIEELIKVAKIPRTTTVNNTSLSKR